MEENELDVRFLCLHLCSNLLVQNIGHKIALESCIWDCFTFGFNKLYTSRKDEIVAFRILLIWSTQWYD